MIDESSLVINDRRSVLSNADILIRVATSVVRYDMMAAQRWILTAFSDWEEREAIMDRFIRLFGHDCIDCLVADREFIGKEWIGWLNDNRIRYYIRIRQDIWVVKPSTGERIRVWWLFNSLKVGQEKFYYKLFLHKGQYVYLAGSRIKNSDGIPELQILICFNRPEDGVATYKKRWEIETAFRAMKSSGFKRTPTCVTEGVSHVCLRWSALLLYGRISLVNIKIYTLNRL